MTSWLLQEKAYDEPSVFRPENLLREARRQNQLEAGSIPAVCVLDPDGDFTDFLRREDRARPHPHWPGYHTRLYETESAIARARAEGALGVEMEAAALYAFAAVRSKPVVCFAHVTNQMAVDEGDFEKGEAGDAPDGAHHRVGADS